jgi:hypothetical protein
MPQTLSKGSINFSTENWKVHHPDGRHMFTCGERKAKWYMDRKLAHQIGEKAIQFNFEPKGNGFKEHEVFGLSGRIAQCVVTGQRDELQRHHIVPYCYRSHFPKEYKSKNHHDVVLVHYKVHEEYEKQAIKFKDQMALRYGIKTLSQYNLEYTKAISSYFETRVKTLSKFHALFTSYNYIPDHVIADNLAYVAKHVPLNYEWLCSLNYMQLWKVFSYLREKHEKEFDYFKKQNEKRYDHGYHLVQKLNTHQEYVCFIREWRQHFVDTMNPQYMPMGWSVDFKVKVEV